MGVWGYGGMGVWGYGGMGVDLGLFRTSKRPSNRGGLDLGLFRKSKPTLREGGGGWALDFKKERVHYLGGVLQSDARMRRRRPCLRSVGAVCLSG